MPDPNQDSSFKPKPPWQTTEEVEPEGTTESTPPWTEEPKEEIDLTKTWEEEETPEAEETPPPPPEATPPEVPPEIASREIPTEEPYEEEPSVESPTPGPADQVQAFHTESKLPLGPLKKILPLILGLILVIGLVILIVQVGLPRLSSVGLPSLPIPGQEVTLTYWGLWEPESVMNQIIADWNKEHPSVKINYSMQSQKQYRERLQSALARDEGPDIFRYHATWVPMLKSQLDPLPADVMSASQFEATFYPVASNFLRSGTNHLGLPLEIDTLVLFYNKNIFQTAGKTPPTTWDELRRVAIELTTHDEAGRIQTAGAALGTTNNVEHWSDILGLMMLQNEADLTNPTGPLAEDALTYYTIFNKEDRVWDLTLPNSTLAFANGKVAMYFGFSWDVFEIKKMNPNLEFGIVKAPQLAGTNISWASFWVEGVNTKGKHKKEAWEFLKYLSTQEALTKLYQAESQLRLFGEPYSRVDMASQIKTDPMAAPFVEQAPQAQTWYLCSRTYDNGINDKMIEYFKDAVNAVNDGEDAEDALETAASGVSQLLSQYGIVSMITH